MADHTKAASVIHTAPAGYVEYEIDIERVLRSDLPGVLDKVPLAPLTREAIEAIPVGAKGAYVLYERGHPVYAGKTDTRHGFRDRLGRHAFTVQHRQNLNPDDIAFKAIRILVFSNFDVEAILINSLREADATALLWNTSGFGSNDPGHRRETQEPADFDKQRPIDIDRPLEINPGRHQILALFIELKETLPYLFRYQTDSVVGAKGKERQAHYRVGHEDFRAAGELQVGSNETMRSLIVKSVALLPDGWLATVFPDRVILYKEPDRYGFALEELSK
ncbi:GIY-YIG nuclease family protein [Altererythrobacter confluentis]|uniref:GIY-YIG nuclease family protein n=1 Tax=Allopontixanthobacter confluentis TaxID=1849021 RepID=A0A6L7GHD0_9SPHN|nr:GIY-YIG nuclease family protein [Allopontixanthobacter confluentis]MXP15327.1 GIY-YIG nuclease family protein [Allopontixanthobacter confluentis]